MSSGRGSPTTERAGRTPAVPEPILGIFRGFDLTLQADSLYDLDSEIQDVIGLRLMRQWLRSCQSRTINVFGLSFRITISALMSSMMYSYMIWRTRMRTPLMCQSVIWGVFDWTGRKPFFHTWDVIRWTYIENVRHECRERFGSVQSGLCTDCRKFIHSDLGRHVAHFHLDLAQLWMCSVSWYTI